MHVELGYKTGTCSISCCYGQHSQRSFIKLFFLNGAVNLCCFQLPLYFIRSYIHTWSRHREGLETDK